ncbi:PE family protein [Mycobacterium asiaticum]|uniref:PE family protein n=2 Tax=Mycobacterium asiaticum TaxID=1790 RepID=A0A1A3CEI9_MYCAS|nr:PE family protein [Mycobacterium asiaticum]
MDSMSHNPAAGDIGSQLVDIGSQGISAGSTAAMSVLSGLVPAGGEEVSAQAVLAFAQEAATMLASNTAAQEELMRTGSALTDIARMYGESDDNAAGALLFSANPMSRLGSASASASSGGAGLGAAALQSELAAAASNPLVAGAAEASTSSVTSAAANAGSAATSGAAPLGSGMGAGSSAGGASKPSLASATAPDESDDSSREDRQDREDLQDRQYLGRLL